MRSEQYGMTKFKLIMNNVLIEGRGLEDLSKFLEKKGVSMEPVYKFNNWFLYPEMVALHVEEDALELILKYYEGRRDRNVEVTVNGHEKVDFKNLQFEEIRQHLMAY